MKTMPAVTSMLIAIVLAAGCSDNGPELTTVELTVMTRNVYVGADIDQIILAQTPEEFVLRVVEQWQMLQATNFDERADALADEIAEARPDLVGLQEVTRFRIQSPGDAVIGGTVPAETEYLDFLTVLQAKLAERGLSYVVAGSVANFDVEVPLATSETTFNDIRLTDYDVLLARSDVGISSVAAANYQATLPVTTPGGGALELKRGWIAATATIGGVSFRFVTTHLEPADYTDLVQAAQLAELQQLLAPETRPLILVGDLNSESDGSGTPTYAALRAAGFEDVFELDATPDGDGMTCCHALDLRNASVNFTKRIDHILLRNAVEPPEVDAWVVGDELGDRTPSGLWPSDHAGVVAVLRYTLQGN